MSYHYALLLRSLYPRLHVLIALTIVMAIVLIGGGLYTVERHLLARAGEELAVLAVEIADQLDQELFERYGDIQVASKALVPSMQDQAALDRYLHLLEEQYVQYRWLAVIDGNGRIVAATNPTDVGSDRSREAWFQSVKESRATHIKSIADLELARGGLTVGYSAPIVGDKGDWLGVVTARIGLDQLEDVFLRPVVPLQSHMAGVAGSIEWQLLDRDGSLLVDSMLRESSQTNLRILGLPSARLSADRPSGYVEEMHARRDVPVVTGYARTTRQGDSPGFGWTVLVRVDRDEVVAPIRRTIERFGLIGLGVWGPTVVFLLWVARRLQVEWTTSHQRGEWLKTVLTGMGDAVIATDVNRQVAFMNTVAEEMTGRSLEEAVGKQVDDVVVVRHEETSEIVGSPAGHVLRDGQPVERNMPMVMVAKDETEYPVEERAAPVRSAAGVVVGTVLVYRNIAHVKKRQQVERALKESELRFRSLVHSAPDAIVVADRLGDIRSWNAAAVRMFGYEDFEVLGQPLAMLMPERYRADHGVRFQQAMEASEPPLTGRMLEVHGLRRDGTEFPLECSLAMWGGGEERFVCGMLRDVTDRARAERRIRAEHAIAKILAESSSVKTVMSEILKTVCETLGWDLGIVWLMDRQAHMLRFGESWSASGAALEPFETASRNNTFAPGVGLPGHVWAGNEPWWITNVQTEANFPRAPFAEEAGLAGAIGFPIVAGQTIVGVLEFFSRRVRPPDEDMLAMMAAIVRQIGLYLDRARIEEQFRQAQKMDAVGKLAGGVAHDFNNLLTVIGGNAELVLAHRPLDVFTAAHVEELRKAAQRAAALTHQLLAFSRRQMLDVKVVGINGLVDNMETMLRRLIGEHIQLETVLSADAGWVLVDPGQVEQVIVNLVVNARDAMETGGTLTIETATVELDEEYARRHEEIVPGPYVMLAVSDTGHGMTPEVQAHIFEPFFTTKPLGKGTGLGLATVYGIVNQSKGSIWLYSEPGRGTTFKIYLPKVVEQEVQAPLPPPAVSISGSETILLVEDEEGVRCLARQILTMDGYTALTAENGEAALELCARYAGPIHLLITDVVMPRMNGRRLADCMKAIRPEMKVLYMSGYTENGISHHGDVDADTPFLQKPFTLDAFRRKVREVLDQKHGETPPQT